MPAKLQVETVPVKWRISEEDYALLQFLYADAPGGVNAAVRTLLGAFCARKREQIAGRG